jgi:hypothetical protein
VRRICKPSAWNVPIVRARAVALSQQVRDALAHLLGGLVRERHGADRLRRDAEREQVRDPERDHARLARAGACEHEDRPAAVARCLALRRVQLAQVDVHGRTSTLRFCM